MYKNETAKTNGKVTARKGRTMKVCKGDIYITELKPNENGENIIRGVRPVLIVSNDQVNRHSSLVTIVPLTSKLHKKDFPTNVLIEGCGTRKTSIIKTEQIMSLNKNRLGKRIGTIRETIYESQVEQAIRVQLNM